MIKNVAQLLDIDLNSYANNASALAYWTKPFAVRWRTSHFSGTFCFDTLAEAFAYIDQQWASIRNRVAAERYFASDLRRSELIANGQRIPLSLVLLADDVSSY